MALVQTVHLSMANFKSAPVVPAVQNDTDRQVKMILDDYTLTSGLTGKIAFERSDGTHYETAAELVLVDNAFVADIDQALTQPGRTMVQLKVTDTLTVSTFSFVIFVEADNSGTVTPQEGIDLVTAVEAAEDAADRAESAASTLELDATLTSATKAAQAKAVGDALALKASTAEVTAAISANVDGTLSMSGKSADAKKTGEIKSAMTGSGVLSFTALDLSKYDITAYFINSSNKWSDSGTSIFIPRSDFFFDTISVKANSSYSAFVSFLTTNQYTPGGSASYASGTSRNEVTTGETSTFTLPSDCEYVNICIGSSSGNRAPEFVKGYQSSIAEMQNNFNEIDDEFDLVWDGNNGQTVYTKAQLLSAFSKYSTGVLYSAADSRIGKTFPDQITTTANTGAYAILFDISDVVSITYPKYKNTNGNGCLVLDSNYVVTKNLPCISDSTGTMATVTFGENDKYFLFGVNGTLAGNTWNFTIQREPLDGINDLKEDITENRDNIDKIMHGIVLPSPKLDAEIVGYIAYGQSWSMGYDTQAISLSQRYDNLMLDCGLMNDPASDLTIVATDFDPLVEHTVYATSSQTQTCGETPCTAQTDIVKQMLLSENGLDTTDAKYQIFSAAPGMGNKSFEELAKGTDYYQRLIDVITAANALARADNKVFVVPAISWMQGSSTNNDSTYYDLLGDLQADLDEDIKAITGQTLDVKLIVWQAVFDNTTPKRSYDRYVYASEKYPNIICSGTFYYLEHVANNNLHLTAKSQDWLGAQLGIAYKRTIVDGEKFIPLKPKKVEVYGNIAYLDFYVPVAPLVFDTTLVASNTAMGFQIIDSESAEKTISAVEIVAPDRVKIVCESNLATTDHIVYGGNGGSDYSPTTGKRGNLRDSQNIVYKNHAGDVLPCYNWCVVFDKTISELTVSN